MYMMNNFGASWIILIKEKGLNIWSRRIFEKNKREERAEKMVKNNRRDQKCRTLR